MSYLGMPPPPDILLDANSIHRHGSWRRGGHPCPCVNGGCQSPVGACNSPDSAGWRVFADGLACLLFAGERVRSRVGVCAGRQWSSVLPCVCVSGGQGDKGVCSSLIRTPTSTSLSLHCSTALLSIIVTGVTCSETVSPFLRLLSRFLTLVFVSVYSASSSMTGRCVCRLRAHSHRCSWLREESVTGDGNYLTVAVIAGAQ